jgi:3-hydroxyacyl-[acyl-carrier-protein] dehydratase
VRFLFYDRVDRLEEGRRIVGTKTFALSEEYLEGHFSREAIVPGVILVEAMAQLLGWAIVHAHGFKLSAIVSLVEGLTIAKVRLRPGFAATITGEILSNSATDSLGRAWMTVEGDRLAGAERIIFTHFPAEDPHALEVMFRYCSGLDRHQPDEQSSSDV